MSRFPVAARQVLECPGPQSGRAWIAFHRAVEAFSRLSGEPFTAIFARLGAAFGFHRRERVGVAPLQAAVRALIGERETLLAARAGLVAARRQEKAAGRRVCGDRELGRLEAAHREGPRPPPLGYWGWRGLRGGDWGGLRVWDGRGQPVPAALPADGMGRRCVLIGAAGVEAWVERAPVVPGGGAILVLVGAAPPEAIGRLTAALRPRGWTVCRAVLR